MRATLVLTGCAIAALGLSACESTQTKSAKLAKEGHGKASLTTVSAGATNSSVKVGETAILNANGLHAAVVELDNTGSAPEAEVPVLIDVKDAKGASVYRNDIQGLQPSLQQLSFLDKGEKTYWVNDQVLATAPKSLTVTVGKAKGTVGADIPKLTLTQTHLATDSTGVYATGVVTNDSKIVQRNVPIFVVALKGGKVIAAGRGLVPRLDPQPTKKPTTFRVFFVGNPKGGDLKFTVAPTAMKEIAG